MLVVVACATAACGGSDGSGSPGAESADPAQPAVTRAAYIAKADAFCKDANDEAREDNARVARIADRAETEDEVFRAITPIYEKAYKRQREQADEFQRIESPPADREILEKIRTARDEQNAVLGRLTDAAKSRDLDRFRSLDAEGDRVTTRAQGLAQGYGFKECGSGKNAAD